MPDPPPGQALFSARRADIECFARDLEARARATITRRLCTIAGLYRYAVEEKLLDHSPAVHVRRPRLDYESHATALDRNELGALLVAAGLGPHTLCCSTTFSLLLLVAYSVGRVGLRKIPANCDTGITPHGECDQKPHLHHRSWTPARHCATSSR
jgi:integrase